MDRRVLFTGLGALVAGTAMAAPAFAQTQPMPMMGERMGPDEATHMKQILAVGSLSLLASRMAVKMVTNRKLLEFVKFEVAEQEIVADILMGMMKSPAMAMGTVTPPTDDQARANLEQDGMDQLSKLQGMSGTAFEKTYVQAEIDGHQKLLDIQNTYLGAGKNREELNVAKLAKGMIMEHLQLLSDLQSMKMRKRDAAST